jgi:hypothetical protein
MINNMAGSRIILGARRCRSEGDTTDSDHVFLPGLGDKIKFHSFEDQESDLI